MTLPENPSGGSRNALYGRTDTYGWMDGQTDTYGRMDGQTDMTKLLVASRNFAIAPKNRPWCIGVYNRD